MKIKIPVDDILKPGQARPVLNEYKHFGYYDTRNKYKLTKQLLKNKRPDVGEIELTLFENCNIVCDFCYHDKKSTVGMTREEILSKLDIIEPFLRDREGTVDLMRVNLVGGELFQDKHLDTLLPIYYELSVGMQKLADKYNHNLDLWWVSNFLFKDKEKIKQLMDDLKTVGIKSSLVCSYDLSGRPMNNRYYKNVEWLCDYIDSVNLVATTDTIETFITTAAEQDFFQYLYNTHHMYFDNFVPDKGSEALLPSDKEIYDLYVFLADYYPKIHPVKELVEYQTKMSCLSLNKISIFPDNSTSNCRWHRYDQGDFNTKLDYKDNAGMMQNFLDTHGCLTCQYFTRCGFRCFTQWDWKKRERDDTFCFMKKFFDYIEEK